MIVSFYDKNFKGLQNNASLVIEKDSYNLIKRSIEMNDLSCICEAFTEDIQPTFLVIKDNLGRYVYGSLAGIPLLNEKNQTEINGTDLKSMLSCDVVLSNKNFNSVNEIIQYIFDQWKSQVNNPFERELKIDIDDIPISHLSPEYSGEVYNAWEEIQSYLKFYTLFMDTKIDLVNKKIQFIIGKSMFSRLNIKLWEYGLKNYGKWIADINECQGYNPTTKQYGTKWILTSQNLITDDESERDIYPIKRRVITNDESLEKANEEALIELIGSMFNENIEISTININPSFESNFWVYTKKGQSEPYKKLPCGELHYNANGLYKFQIGYRFTGAEFI